MYYPVLCCSGCQLKFLSTQINGQKLDDEVCMRKRCPECDGTLVRDTLVDYKWLQAQK